MWRSLALVALIVSACGGETPNGARLGVPDPAHGPPVDGDIDGDGVLDGADNCPSLANADQREVCTYVFPPPPPTGVVEDDAVARLDYYRAMVGLGSVDVDPALSEGCRLHLDYLRQLSLEMGAPQLTHGEDTSRSYSTAEGAQAGGASVLYLGTPDIATSVDGWINSLYHRLPLLHPGLHTVGASFMEEPLRGWRWACLQYRPGTDASVAAPHPILWPPPDVPYTARSFAGAESPCPTDADPLMPAGACMGGAGIATLGVHGMGALSEVTGSITRLDDGSEVPLFHVWYDGGPSPHEQMGYLEGSAGLVPEVGSEYVRAPYEVRVDGSLDAVAQTWRWRFDVAGLLREDLECDVFGPQGSFDQAIRVTIADLDARICEAPDFYVFRDPGTFTVTLVYDPSRGDLDLYAYDDGRTEIAAVTGPSSPARLVATSAHWFEVRGAHGDVGPYSLLIEAAN